MVRRHRDVVKGFWGGCHRQRGLVVVVEWLYRFCSAIVRVGAEVFGSRLHHKFRSADICIYLLGRSTHESLQNSHYRVPRFACRQVRSRIELHFNEREYPTQIAVKGGGHYWLPPAIAKALRPTP